MQLLELRVQLHELPRHAVDASVQVPVLAVLPVEVLLVALSPLGAAYPRVRPEQGAQTNDWHGDSPQLQSTATATYLQQIVRRVAAPFRHLGGKQRFTWFWKNTQKQILQKNKKKHLHLYLLFIYSI